ncbi:MAG: hypothetical protein K2H02_02290 [Anaeroplasmataceae bacterium]|nr:hypothetical protein [Anaeroplasmataceae bacterium]
MRFQISNQQSITETLKKLSSGDTLILSDGIYHEKLEIWQDNITIQAEHPQQAIISNKDYYHKIMPNHNECNTFGTYTLYIGGNHITLDGLTIENQAVPSKIYGQAVALYVNGNDFRCLNCKISSAQDTLFTGPLPKDLLKRYEGFYDERHLKGAPTTQYYYHCQIIGDVDFIFGCSTALFEECDIITLDRSDNLPSYICAPAHALETPFGYLFYHCNLKGTTPTYLARPWRDYGCAAFIECKLGTNILPLGFNKWNDTNRDQTARFYEYSPDSITNDREPWSHQLTKQEAQEYVLKFKQYFKNQSAI